MLSKALLETHSEAETAGLQFSPEIFVAGRNRLENEGASALAEVLSTVGSFKRIQMPQNSIFHQGVAALAKAVLANPQLEVSHACCHVGVCTRCVRMCMYVGSGKFTPVVSLRSTSITHGLSPSSTWTSVITSSLRWVHLPCPTPLES